MNHVGIAKGHGMGPNFVVHVLLNAMVAACRSTLQIGRAGAFTLLSIA